MELLPEAQTIEHSQVRAGKSDAYESERARLDPVLQHQPKGFERDVPLFKHTERRNHRVPGDLVPLDDSIEHVKGAQDITAPSIQGDKGVGHGDGRGLVTGFDDSGMDLAAGVEVVEARGGFDGSGEGKVVGGDAGGGHIHVTGEGGVESVGAGVGAEGLDP